MTTVRRFAGGATLVALVLVAGACGSDKDSSSTTAASATTAAASTTAAATTSG